MMISFLLITKANCFAQSNKKEVRKIVEQMFLDIQNENYKASVEMMHPKVFEIVPKEQMTAYLKASLAGNEEFKIEMSKEEPKYKISEIFKEATNNLEYAFVSYDLKMKMTILQEKIDEVGKERMRKVMKQQGVSAEFISDSVLNITKKDMITVVLKEDATQNKWVTTNFDGSTALMSAILSTETIAEGEKYKEKLRLEREKKNE